MVDVRMSAANGESWGEGLPPELDAFPGAVQDQREGMGGGGDGVSGQGGMRRVSWGGG